MSGTAEGIAPSEEAVVVACPCGRRYRIEADSHRDVASSSLVVLAEGWGPVAGATLQRWAKSGRLSAFRLERGKLVAWERDIRRAVEADAVRLQTQRSPTRVNHHPLLDDPELVADEPAPAG